MPHDILGTPFDEIAPIVERTPDAARQLASRARRRVQERKASPDADVVLVNGAAGLVCTLDGKPFSVMAFTVRGGKIAEIDILSDPERLGRMDLTRLESAPHG